MTTDNLLQNNPNAIPALDIKTRLENLDKLKWFKDVFKWTFAYDEQSKLDWTPYNTTYFKDIWGVSYEDYKSWLVGSEELIKITNQKFADYRNELLEIKKELETQWDDEKTKLEIEWIDYIILSLDSAVSSIEVELEKAWIYKLTDEKREELELETQRLQILLYWPDIEDSKEEIDMTLKLMCEEFYDNRKYLSEEEQIEYVEIYDKIVESLHKKWKNDIQVPDIWTYKYEKPYQNSLSKELLEVWEKIDVDKADYMKVWQFAIYANNLSQEVEEDPNFSSLYDSPKKLLVPKSENYKTQNFKDVITLIQHEIAWHYINQAIHENAEFQVRWAKNVIKEEWLAIIYEKLN